MTLQLQDRLRRTDKCDCDHPDVATELQAHLDKVMETIHLTEGQLSQISETDTLATVPGVKW